MEINIAEFKQGVLDRIEMGFPMPESRGIGSESYEIGFTTAAKAFEAGIDAYIEAGLGGGDRQLVDPSKLVIGSVMHSIGGVEHSPDDCPRNGPWPCN